VKKPERRQYLKKPPGAKRDRTRSPRFYEGVSQYLNDLGVPQV